MARRPRRRRLSVGSVNTSFNADTTSAKQSSVEPSDLDGSFVDLGENDDNEERKQNRKNPQMRRNSLAPMPMVTPIRSTRGSHRHRHSSRSPFPPSGMRRTVYTNEQLSQIYKDCIIKAQQGKINQQNAWNLHLVDNIQAITELNTGSSNNNNSNNTNTNLLGNNAFARASHTIDAASKIYGYRVDSVHNKTYKVLGSIHQQNDNLNDDLNMFDENDKKKKRKERNRNVGKCTLIEAEKIYKINETMKNLCVEVDALFHKTASCFDEGGAKGLLMNTLYVQNGCDIVFDSTTKIEQNKDITNNGVIIDHTLIEDENEINKEHEWMTQLAQNTFCDFTQPIDDIDISNVDYDISTQTKPQNFKIDMKWLQNTSICPILNIFENNIKAMQQNMPMDLSMNNNNNNNNNISPEKDLNAGDMDFDDDNDIMMDMPDFTLTQGDDGLNAQDLFHEELMTQQVDQIPIEQIQVSQNNNNILNSSRNILEIPVNPEYVLGQNGNNIIGNMGVQPLLDVSMNDNAEILNNLQLEVENTNGEYNNLHRQGIYKRGAMNINAMNNIISKLENADFESLTSFFDTKKHGNWAGPDQWYHRRYLMTLKKHNTKTSNSNHNSNNNNNNNNNNESNSTSLSISPSTGKKRTRKVRKSTRFDFMSIANGNLISESEFDEPPRAYNTLTQAVLDKNRKTFHTLPKDLQIKPDMFIKLFHRPNYSVWKHWLRQHQLRMIKQKEEQKAQLQQEQQEQNGNGNINDGMQLDLDSIDVMMNHSVIDGGIGYGGFGNDDIGGEPQFIAQQAAAMAVIDVNNMNDDDEDEFKYDYNNPLDSSHFVPNMNDSNNSNDINFNFNYDLIDMDSNKRVKKIQIAFATTAKKVNVRKLKLRLWDKINNTLPMDIFDKENINNNNNNNNNNNDDDIDMNNNENKVIEKVTFQDTLNSLPSNLSSAISVHMCFICLLHLANEKVLQFVPKDQQKERGDFVIEYANSQSAFEKDAQKINPVMVLGMRN